MEKKRHSSSRLAPEFILEYGEFENLPYDFVIGYKLVRKMHGNYYSVATGLQRYKPGRTDAISAYYKLYEDTKYYRKEMIGRIAVFNTLEDLYKVYGDKIDKNEHAILKMRIAGNIQGVKASNVLIYIGDVIVTIEELKNGITTD